MSGHWVAYGVGVVGSSILMALAGGYDSARRGKTPAWLDWETPLPFFSILLWPLTLGFAIPLHVACHFASRFGSNVAKRLKERGEARERRERERERLAAEPIEKLLNS